MYSEYVCWCVRESREQQTDEVNKFLCAGNCNFLGSRFVEFHFLANIVYYISVHTRRDGGGIFHTDDSV